MSEVGLPLLIFLLQSLGPGILGTPPVWGNAEASHIPSGKAESKMELGGLRQDQGTRPRQLQELSSPHGLSFLHGGLSGCFSLPVGPRWAESTAQASANDPVLCSQRVLQIAQPHQHGRL